MRAACLSLILLASLTAQPPPERRGVSVPPAAAARKGKTYALLIGISTYQHDPPVTSLQYADKNAEALAALLESPLGGNLKEPDEICLLTNEKATRGAINDALDNFVAPHASPENQLILFVAAHGLDHSTVTDPVTHKEIEREPYILTYDSNTQDVKLTGYPMDELRRMAARQAGHYGQVLVFVDVCHAANVAGIAGESNMEAPVKRIFSGAAGDLDLLLAANAHKFAYESPSFGGGHGAFSYFLIDGLNGAAASPGANSITFADVAAFVEYKVHQYTHSAQLPVHNGTNDDMIVVPDVHQEGVALPPASPLSQADIRDLKRIRGRPPQLPDRAPHAAVPDPQRSLHVTLDDSGQQIMSRYLEGDQVPQLKADFDRCASLFEQASVLTTDSGFDQSRALFCKGRALIFDARFDQAEQLLRDSIRLDPRRAYAYNALGISILERGSATGAQLDAAAQNFRTAMRYAPYWAYPIHNLALLETTRGNYDEAIRLYQYAMSVAPRYSYLPYNLGLLYERLGDLDSAARWFETAREKAETYRSQPAPWPERSRIFNALGTVARSAGRDAKAVGFFHQALDDDAANFNARHNLALLLDRRDDHAQADALWEQNLAVKPMFTPSWIAYAESLRARGALDRALPLYEGIVAALPQYVGARETLARLYLGLHRPADAISQLDAALKSSPSSAALFQLRADARAMLNDRPGAASDLNQALALADDRAVRSRIKARLRTVMP